MNLWGVYKKIEEYAKNFCYSRFNYSQVKEEECFLYITDKVLDNDMAKIKSFKGKCKASTYAYIVAKNLLTDFTKKLSTNVKKYELKEELYTIQSSDDLDIDLFKKHLQVEQILILEFKIDGLKSKEIAPLLKMSSKEVDAEYQKIKKVVKKLLDIEKIY